MIDTVMVTYPLSPTNKQLKDWPDHPLLIPNEKPRHKYFKNAFIKGNTPIGFIYYPPNPKYPEPHLRIQVSLPNVLFGNNIEMITEKEEIERAIGVVNKFIRGLKWMPDVDFGEGILWRVDAAYNYSVGEHVQDYITAISKLSYPGRQTAPYLHEGVQYRVRAKHPVVGTKFYDKQKECHKPEGWGLLRQESFIQRSYYIERHMGMQNPTLRDISIEWLGKMLQDDLFRLRLKDCIICERDLAIDLLTKRYGWNIATKLFGYLISRQSLTLEQMLAKEANKRSIQRWNRMITEAGVSLAIIDKTSLPPLILDLPK